MAQTGIYIALLHYPVYNKSGAVVTTCITPFDLHDISRTACTYGIKKYYVVNPLPAQRTFAKRIIDHWLEEERQNFNPTRVQAFELVRIKEKLDEVIEEIGSECGTQPVKVATSAKGKGSLRFAELRQRIKEDRRPYLILFGTGWGLSKELMDSVDCVLEPIHSPVDYNHLSVRSAAAIILDRLLGK